MTQQLEYLESLVLGQNRGSKNREPLTITASRSLTAADLPALVDPPPLGTKPKVAALRHSHHQIARLVAIGKPDVEIALITGYDPAYICNLKHGQDFQELVAYYATQRDLAFTEVMDRMKQMGLDTIDEIQRRFAENPEAFTNTQLMELTELMIIKPMRAQQPAAQPFGPAGAVAIQINVAGVRPPPSAVPLPQDGATIDVAPRLVSNGR